MFVCLNSNQSFICIRLHGSYEALKGGKASEAMVDFTGGVTEAIDLKKPAPKLFRNLLKASERNALMSCSIGVRMALRGWGEGLQFGIHSILRRKLAKTWKLNLIMV